MKKTKQIHLWISGLVQGVSFRYFIHSKAEELGIKGWVKNLSDGRVEIHAQGEKDILEKFIKWCWQGPSFSRVENVQIEKEELQEKFKDFQIIF